jgi:hypothetical protein
VRAKFARIGVIDSVKRGRGVEGCGVERGEADGLEPGGHRANLEQEDQGSVFSCSLSYQGVAARADEAEGNTLGVEEIRGGSRKAEAKRESLDVGTVRLWGA